MSEVEFDPQKPDAVFDLDGTVFKFTVLERYTGWLSEQRIFEPMPSDIEASRLVWKKHNTEENYKAHLDKLVQFFLAQVVDKETELLDVSARTVAGLSDYRRWDITENIINELRPTHNVLAISLMPDWLIPPFTRNLGFAATLGSTFVATDGKFTDEAHTIDKAAAYTEFRDGDISMIDVAMGDTMGDLSVFNIARRPIAFNPSFTLVSEVANRATMISAGKDLVTVTNREADGSMRSEQFHCSAAAEVLRLVQTRPR